MTVANKALFIGKEMLSNMHLNELQYIRQDIKRHSA